MTLLATFIGAWSAFKLNEGKEKRKAVEDQVAAANRALFMLLRQYNALYVIKIQVIDPFTKFLGDDRVSSLLMKPSPLSSYSDMHIDVDSLTFLLETEERNMLSKLLIEEERFHHAISQLNKRSEYHLNEVQPRLNGLPEVISRDQILAAIGEDRIYMLDGLTKDAVWQVNTTVETLRSFHEQFRIAMKNMYPKHTFIRIARTLDAKYPPGFPGANNSGADEHVDSVVVDGSPPARE